MISPMSFVQILGPRDSFQTAIDTIHEAGVLQIEEVPLAEADGDALLHRAQLSDHQASQKEIYAELVELLDKEVIRHIPRPVAARVETAPAFAEQYRQWSQQSDEAVAAAVRALHAEVRSFVRRQRNLDDDLRVLTAYEEVVAAMAPMVESQELPADYEFVGVVFERKNRQARGLLQEQLARMTAGEYRFFSSVLTKGRVAALIGFHKQFATEVRAFIAEAGISEIRGPRYLRDKPFEQALAALENDLEALREQRQDLAKRQGAFYREKDLQLRALQCLCHDRLSRLQVVSKFTQTRYTFIIEGWAPTARVGALQARLAQACDWAVTVRTIRAHGAASTPPVLLDNPRPIRAFQGLLALLPLPRYGSIDPTSYVAMFFPPIFGLMLGDIGYGLLLAFGALALWRFGRSNKIMRALVPIVGSCAFFTIAFGFVFGELFGSVGHLIGLKPLWRGRFELHGPDRGSALLAYLILAVAVGAAHVLCGLVLGIINARRSGRHHQALDCVARIAGIFGLFFIVGRLARFLPPPFTSLGVVAMMVFFVLMAWASIRHPMHGLMLPLELLGTVGNIFSYARIMAVGLASAVLAMLANHFGGMTGNIVLAAIVVVLIHALNLVLGVVDPTIQGLRLHYVEFFSKFYEPGGRVYSPFRKMGDKVL